MSDKFLPLSTEAINQLKSQGCSAENWSDISFVSESDIAHVQHVRFSGKVQIGKLEKTHKLPGGMPRHSGIFSTNLHNVIVGDDCLIEQVGMLANYRIAEECIIQQVGTLITEGKSTFGNGTKVAVLDETGSREVWIHNTLTAQEAYLQAMFRQEDITLSMHKLLQLQVDKASSEYGEIGMGAVIRGANKIVNVHIQAYARVEYASELVNGTICSCLEAPSFIGTGVLARDFIVLTDAKVDGCARLQRCFVGQGTHIGNGFSAIDSLFFANCQAENGEACALFAGPFTVTHHKSTLLIGMMTSFMNAGSGTNQSNHAYKLGPMHQGIMDRGSKTGSSSYQLWPAHIGAFTIVLGHHTSHPNTSDFPFSYLLEQEGKSLLIPGATLNTVGTLRDASKWPKRDMRHPHHRLDILHYDTHGIYLQKRMLAGVQRLKHFIETGESPFASEVLLTQEAAKKGIQYYEDTLLIAFINQLTDKLSQARNLSQENLIKSLRELADTPFETKEESILDIAGAYVKESALQALLASLSKGEITSIHSLHQAIEELADADNATDSIALLSHHYLYGLADVNLLVTLLKQYEYALTRSHEHLVKDAQKETVRKGLEFDDASERSATFIQQQEAYFKQQLAMLHAHE